MKKKNGRKWDKSALSVNNPVFFDYLLAVYFSVPFLLLVGVILHFYELPWWFFGAVLLKVSDMVGHQFFPPVSQGPAPYLRHISILFFLLKICCEPAAGASALPYVCTPPLSIALSLGDRRVGIKCCSSFYVAISLRALHVSCNTWYKVSESRVALWSSPVWFCERIHLLFSWQ